MKKAFIFLSWVSFVLVVHAQPSRPEISIIPQPVKMEIGSGFFSIPKECKVQIESTGGFSSISEALNRQLAPSTGVKFQISKADTHSSIRFVQNSKREDLIGNEGYELLIDGNGILIKSNQPAGLYYGLQSLLQLLPKEVESHQKVSGVTWKVPYVHIVDYPRFGWRGLMLDVSRHFFTVDQVKGFIDQMVKYKYNLLHWHLTDDEGWRIEIKSLPRLTEVGAWNVKRVGTFGEFADPDSAEPRNYGGFYSQEEIKEIVLYAKSRFVNVMPEVDVPGHSLAAIVSYPDLSCTEGAEKYRVRSGEKIMNWDGGMTALVDNTLCPANERVYAFLDKVFTELAQLFPFEYIHVGGDECAKNFWEKNTAVKALAAREGLKNMEEVQSYFEKRIEKIVMSKGKKLIGWDEILEGGLAPSAAVMSWRGMKGGIEAAKMGHEVVMSPTTYVYVDYMQSDRLVEPPVYATLRLKKTYEFEPLPEGVDPKWIKGGQANLWTEQIYNTRHMQYMLWPRALAVSECLWSPKELKNWDSFAKRTEAQMGRMDQAEVKYSRAMFDPIFEPSLDAKSNLLISLSSEVNGLDIYYSFDNSQPDNYYPKYTSSLSVPKEATMLKVVTYRNGKPIGRQIDMPIKELQARVSNK